MGNWKSKSQAKTISHSGNQILQQQATKLPNPRRLLHYLEQQLPSFYMTQKAFYLDKPLFEKDEKARAFAALRRFMPTLSAGFARLDRLSMVEERRDAQISRSGLQFIADEVTEEEDPELHQQLHGLINSSCVRSIQEFIKSSIDWEREWGTDEDVDPSLIPSSHYWWFYLESDDEDEE